MTARIVVGHRAVVLHRRMSSAVWVGSERVERVLTRTVPAAHREYDRFDRAHVVFGSRVGPLLEAFAAAGVDVDELGGDR